MTQLCEKQRFLEIIHDFIIFDAGTKKLCRPNQYFGVRAAQERIRKREGGIIWHSQGSGKSLTMVWLAKWIREHVTDSRVLIITDRTELDEQIEKVFLGVDEEIYRTSSGKDLLAQLNQTIPWLICSLIHKFVGKKELTAEDFIEELKSNLPPDFKPKGDIYVFVDECHRTQSGALHHAMKEILPNAMFIGFTGTPLLKADKETSIETFGTYIHTYKFDEAVRDQVVLDLRYEARNIEQSLTSPKKIDQWFAAKTKGLNPAALTRLKQKWGTMQKVLSSQSRLEKIVADILLDMELKERLENGRGNAMLVSGSIYQACKLYELFLARGFDKCAIVTSYKPSPSDVSKEETGEGQTEKLRQYEIYNKMLGNQTPEAFEKEVKKKFIETPGQMKLLIVVDKLLTGFDAPSATYLYIDKKMQDHGLFQAICRVNRLDGEDKEYGYIIDYKDLFKSLENSITDYTSEALEGYEKQDVEGLLSDRIKKGRQKLDEAREKIKALCDEAVDPPQDTLDYLRYFCANGTSDPTGLQDTEPRRGMLYKLTATLLRSFTNLANDLPEAGYSPQEIEILKKEVRHYEMVCAEVKNFAGDNVDLKVYEPAMRHLIDTYIRAEESETLSAFEDISLIDMIVNQGIGALEKKLPKGLTTNKGAMAETIENNLRKVIINEQPLNPAYYDNMSILLDNLIKKRQEEAMDYKRYLDELTNLANKVKNPNDNTDRPYPDALKTPGQKAIYDQLAAYDSRTTNQEAIAKALDSAVRNIRKDSWRNNYAKEKEVRIEIRKVLRATYNGQTNEELEPLENQIFQVVKKQKEY
ncbi:restriction endonuclease [Dictyobacter kobayashii]|uniref:Type I restriction enzyme endonuclease subunit n=1 Tax=Dictyobacter kobayashii TaxID=2014872 RepID=A0A402APF9_9CHLR|nr:restriction endonuclease [Dictyobacter kobayashii]